ncbi:MAG: indolepyruvate oxidoreductase subunit beta family protein [Betaproteobacteria bacterium]|nr:indolepyruvate oxidoreductase subunit beta family protein [Betaproteobacteria bacterium]
MNLADRRPLTLLICALGGEGGGVLAEWLVETATRSGYSAQSTSIPGVAQRTGSTTYYFEVFPVPVAELGGRKPVFSLYPVPGALDVLVSSELLETVRHIGNGMTSADRTLVVTSSSRTLTTAEKLQLADGRASSEELLKVVRQYSQSARIFDMSAVAQEAGTVLSAVLFGAIAGSGVLPFSREAYEQTIRQSGRGVEPSLRGFARAFEIVARGLAAQTPASAVAPTFAAALPADLARVFPPPTHAMLGAGHARTLEYQDGDYAELYAQRMKRVLEAERAGDPSGEGGYVTTSETARYLALWMAFDDIVRVADLKCRASRFARVRQEVKAPAEDLMRIYDYFKPGVPELAALLPRTLARALIGWDRRRQQNGKTALALPLKIGVHTISGFLALRFLASLKGLRKRGSRFAQEQAMIERWLAAVEQGARNQWQLGHEIALCGRLVKGYGSTNDRGKDNLLHVLDHLAVGGQWDGPQARAEAIRAARVAALADDAGKELDKTLVKHGAAPLPVKAQPIMWVKQRRSTTA